MIPFDIQYIHVAHVFYAGNLNVLIPYLYLILLSRNGSLKFFLVKTFGLFINKMFIQHF